MAEIIHLAPDERPSFDPSTAVYQWMPDGALREKQIAGSGSWYYIPDYLFDQMVAAAGRVADDLGFDRVYIMGCPAR